MTQRSGIRTGLAFIALGILMATSAMLGPLVFGLVRFHTSQTAVNQLVGGEIISLLAVAPLAIVAGILWLRDNPVAPPLGLGTAAYALYTYVQYVIGPQYERYAGNNEYWFPLYLALVVLAWMTAISAWRRLTAVPLPTLSTRIQGALGALMLVLNLLFALAWLSSINAVLTRPHTSPAWQEYELDETLFWLIRLMDLGFVIPASVVIAVGLLRRLAWATRLAYAFLGFQTFIVAAVAGMAVTMTVRHDPAANPVLLLGATLLTVVLAGMFLALLRRLVTARSTA